MWETGSRRRPPGARQGNEPSQTASDAALGKVSRRIDRYRWRGSGRARAILPQMVPDDAFLEVIDG